MTPKESKKSERFKMTFPAKIVGEPIMTKLSHDFGVSYNMIRGRITGEQYEAALAATAAFRAEL